MSTTEKARCDCDSSYRGGRKYAFIEPIELSAFVLRSVVVGPDRWVANGVERDACQQSTSVWPFSGARSRSSRRQSDRATSTIAPSAAVVTVSIIAA
jgi:hypothetical protein